MLIKLCLEPFINIHNKFEQYILLSFFYLFIISQNFTECVVLLVNMHEELNIQYFT